MLSWGQASPGWGMGPTGLLLAAPVPHCHPVHRMRTEGLWVGRDCSQGHSVVSHENGPTLKLVSLQTHPWAKVGRAQDWTWKACARDQELRVLPALRMCAGLRPAELGAGTGGQASRPAPLSTQGMPAASPPAGGPHDAEQEEATVSGKRR